MPLYCVSSTRFGSTINMRSVSGVFCSSSAAMMEFTHTDLPAPVAPAMSMCGMARKSAATACPETSCPRPRRRPPFSLLKASDSIMSRRETTDGSSLGTSMPTKPLPGIGAWMRMLRAESASARSSARLVILLTLTLVVRPVRLVMKSGSVPNCVTTGPWLISRTRTGAPRLSSVFSMLRTCLRIRSSL